MNTNQNAGKKEESIAGAIAKKVVIGGAAFLIVSAVFGPIVGAKAAVCCGGIS